jgi:hypothetical protein
MRLDAVLAIELRERNLARAVRIYEVHGRAEDD